MSQTIINLGYVPTSRSEYSASVKYYKDNIVQYNGSAYIAKPTSTVNDGSEGTGDNIVYYLTRAPYESNASILNAGWETFASVGFIDNEPTAGSDNLVKSEGVFDCVNVIEPLSKKTKLSLWGYYVSNVNTGAISAANSNYNGYIARVNPNFNYIVFGSLSYTGKPVCCYNGIPSTSTFIGLVTNSTGDIRKYSLISGTKYIVMTVAASSEEEIFIEAIASVGTYSLELQDNYVVCSSGANNNKVVNAEGMLNKRHFFVKFTNANTHVSPTLKLQNPLREDVTLPLYYNDSQVSSSNTYQAGEIVEIIRDDDNGVFRGYKFSRGSKVRSNDIEDGAVTKEKMGYDPLSDLNYYGYPDNIIVGLDGATEEILTVARALIKNVRLTSIPEGYTPGCMRIRQIRCNLKSTSSMTLQLQFFTIINNAASNVDTVTFIVSSSSIGTTVVSGTYCEVTVDLDNWDLENLFTNKTDYYYNRNVDNPYQVIPSNDIKFVNGKILEDGSITESKLDNSVKEKLNGGIGSSFLFGKKLVTLCDSLGNLSQWQTRLEELTGAVYDSTLNNSNYSIGGTKTLWADQNGLDGQSRAKKLVQDNLVVPDVIIYENVNDNSDLSNGSSSDESFFRSQQSIITPSTPLATSLLIMTLTVLSLTSSFPLSCSIIRAAVIFSLADHTISIISHSFSLGVISPITLSPCIIWYFYTNISDYICK